MTRGGRRSLTGAVVALAVVCTGGAPRAQTPSAPVAQVASAATLDRSAQAEFLRTAKVIRSRQLSSGVTSPYRLTLDAGGVVHDAAFQSINERRTQADFGARGVEVNFTDSHHFNLAAFTMAGLVGLDGMMPVTVHRTWNGRDGTITWWIDDAFDERTRLKEKRQPPNALAWSHQMHKMRVFAALVGDSDRNLGNVLITGDWKLWMIDFTRAFRLWPGLNYPADLSQIDRTLLARLRTLDADQVRTATAHCVSPFEATAMMKRRDALVTHFDQLVKEKGAGAVLYGAEPPSPGELDDPVGR
jgi:hypothetical protein